MQINLRIKETISALRHIFPNDRIKETADGIKVNTSSLSKEQMYYFLKLKPKDINVKRSGAGILIVIEE